MTFDYAKMQATATRLITDFGGKNTGAVLIGRGSVWNPATAETEYTEVETPLNALSIDNTKAAEAGFTIEQGLNYMVLTSDVEPSNGDQLRIGSDTYQVEQVIPKKPSNTVLVYFVSVRK